MYFMYFMYFMYYCYYQFVLLFVLLIEYLSKFINIDLMESIETIEPMETIEHIEHINDCLICLEKLNKDKHLCITSCCLQQIHLVCIKTCIIFNPLCPNCRNPICKNILYKVKFRTEKQFAEDIAIRQHRFEMLKQIKKINRFNTHRLMPENIGMMVNPLYDVVSDVDNNIDDYISFYDLIPDIDYSDMPELV